MGCKRNDTKNWSDYVRRRSFLWFNCPAFCGRLPKSRNFAKYRRRFGSGLRDRIGAPRSLSCWHRHASDLQACARSGSVILQVNTRLQSSWREVVNVGIELIVASYGSTLSAAGSMYLLYPLVQAFSPSLTFHEFNRVFSVPYFPVQVVFGFAVGCIGRKRFGTRFSLWVWTVPVLIFIWHFVVFQPSVLASFWHSRFEHFLGSGCRPPACFDQLRYTSPLYTSVAYSLGASARDKLGQACRPNSH